MVNNKIFILILTEFIININTYYFLIIDEKIKEKYKIWVIISIIYGLIQIIIEFYLKNNTNTINIQKKIMFTMIKVVINFILGVIYIIYNLKKKSFLYYINIEITYIGYSMLI